MKIVNLLFSLYENLIITIYLRVTAHQILGKFNVLHKENKEKEKKRTKEKEKRIKILSLFPFFINI
jgi:hypothetical protein